MMHVHNVHMYMCMCMYMFTHRDYRVVPRSAVEHHMCVVWWGNCHVERAACCCKRVLSIGSS